jgi:hypothetical protein
MKGMPLQDSVEAFDDERSVRAKVQVTDRVSCDICGYSQVSFPKLLPALARRHVELHCRILDRQRRSEGNETVVANDP